MPVLKFDVQETDTRILYPIAKQTIINMLIRLGIRECFGKNIFISDGRTSNTNINQGGRVSLSGDRVDVVLTYKLSPTDQQWDTSTNYNLGAYGIANNQFAYNTQNYGRSYTTDRNVRALYPMIFKDLSVGSVLSEFTNVCGINFAITISTQTSDLAYRILNILNNSYHGEGVLNAHDFTIKYPLNLSLLTMLLNIYKCKFSVTDKIDNDDFMLYVNDHITDRFLLSKDIQKGDIEDPDLKTKPRNTLLVLTRHIKESLELTTIESTAPEAIADNQTVAGFSLTLNTNLQFSIPTMMLLTVPVVINNNPLPSEFFSNINKSTAGYFSGNRGAYQLKELDQLSRPNRDRNTQSSLIRFPEYDDWYPPQEILNNRSYNSLISAIDIIDNQPTHHIYLLDGLDGYMLSDFAIEILKLHDKDDIFGHDGLFNITIFSQHTSFDTSLLHWDQQTLTVGYDTVFKDTVYRIVLSERIDITKVNPKWYDVLVKYRYYFPLTIARNLDCLIRTGVFSIIPPTNLYNILSTLQRTSKLHIVIDDMIQSGHVPIGIYQYTQTLNQFSWYLTNTRIMTCKDMLQFDPELVNTLPSDIWSKDGAPIPNTTDSLIIKPNDSDNFDIDRLVYLSDLFLLVCKHHKFVPNDTVIKSTLINNNKTASFILERIEAYVYNSPERLSRKSV